MIYVSTCISFMIILFINYFHLCTCGHITIMMAQFGNVGTFESSRKDWMDTIHRDRITSFSG